MQEVVNVNDKKVVADPAKPYRRARRKLTLNYTVMQ